MAVTPNYSWPVPVNTDLVKDGADAIKDLGDAIDATVFGLGMGAVLQVKSVTKTTTFSTTSTSFVDITDLTLTITPTSASNLILVMVQISGIGEDVSDGGTVGFQIIRGATAIGINTNSSDATSRFTGMLSQRNLGPSTGALFNAGANHLDSPATTSATTYKIQGRTAAGTLRINFSGDNAGAVSTLTLMEVTP
jgi:hypothetical protein